MFFNYPERLNAFIKRVQKQFNAAVHESVAMPHAGERLESAAEAQAYYNVITLFREYFHRRGQ